MAISINKVSEEIKQKIIEDYKNNVSLRSLEKNMMFPEEQFLFI